MTRELTQSVSLIYCVLALATAADRCAAQPAPQSPDEIKSYRVDAAMVSFDASQSLDSYRGGGKLSGSPGATLGTSTPDSDISILLLVESNRLYADATIKNRIESGPNNPKKQRFDLTNLRPQVIDLGTAKDGRNYQLTLIPTVRTVSLRPKPFSEAADDLYRLKFHFSRVTLNDEQYVGRMLASDATVFSIDVCDVAFLEFSLRHLKGAKPWGRLQDGRVTFRHPDGTTIEIDNVTNGSDDRVVGNGPYLVWVRWEDPRQTAEEYHTQLAAYRDRIQSGEMPATEGTLAIVEKELVREPGPWVISSGAREPSKIEIVRDE